MAIPGPGERQIDLEDGQKVNNGVFVLMIISLAMVGVGRSDWTDARMLKRMLRQFVLRAV